MGSYSSCEVVLHGDINQALEEQALAVPKEPKDFNYLNCPNRKLYKDSLNLCLLVPKPEEEDCVYNQCNFSGADFRKCSRIIATEIILEKLARGLN